MYIKSIQKKSNYNQIILIKAGGSILHDDQKVTDLCSDVKMLVDAGFKIILVHGGSKAINEALACKGIESEFIDGLRVTSASAIDIIKKVLNENVNENIVKKLHKTGVNSFGLSGDYRQFFLCDYYSKIHGFVGEIKSLNLEVIYPLISSDIVPVISTIGADEYGNALNINADMAACHIANALGVDRLIYLTDQDGIYDDYGETFPKLYEEELFALIEQSIVSGGMLVKVRAILASLKAGLNNISILNGNRKNIIIDVILNEKNSGTVCNL